MALKDALRNIASRTVSVGFLEGATYPDGTSVAEVAYKNEYGGPDTPVRPFMRSTFSQESKDWTGKMADLTRAGYDSDKMLAVMGEDIKGAMVQQIIDWSTPANSQETIARKGFNDPLVDTGHMKDSVEFEVE